MVMVESDGDRPSREAVIMQLLTGAGLRFAYELVLGPQKMGGFNRVFVRRGVKIPQLISDPASKMYTNITNREPASTWPRIFVAKMCQVQNCLG